MSARKNHVLVLILLLLVTVTINSCKKDDGTDNTNNGSTIVFNPSLTYGTMSDQEGNSYKTIQIGNQTWMAENLRVTKYNDGTSIARILVDSAWFNTNTGAYDNYNSTDNADTIRDNGRLYNWYAINTNKLAPAGWHVATEADWDALIANQGGISAAGGKLKETGTTHWSPPNEGATNESGFSALPSGRFYLTAIDFSSYSFSSYFWSATSYSPGEGRMYGLGYTDAGIYRGSGQKKNGFSVRCVKD